MKHWFIGMTAATVLTSTLANIFFEYNLDGCHGGDTFPVHCQHCGSSHRRNGYQSVGAMGKITRLCMLWCTRGT